MTTATKQMRGQAQPAQSQQPGREVVPAPQQELLDQPPTAIQTLDEATRQKSRQIDRTVEAFAAAISQCTGMVERARLQARALRTLREAITPDLMQDVMTLLNDPYGIESDRGTDRQPQQYGVEVVRDAFVTSLMHGFRPIGYEWGIISGKFYGKLNGWMRKLEDVPGISNISVVAGEIRRKDGFTYVSVAISWKLNGVFNQLTNSEGKPGQWFTVNDSGKEKPDTILGKGKAKAYKAAFRKATGSTFLPDEADDANTSPPPDALPAARGPQAVQQQLAAHPVAREAAAAREPLVGRARNAMRQLRESGWNDDDFADLAERLGVPAALDRQTAEELARSAEALEAAQAKLAAPAGGPTP